MFLYTVIEAVLAVVAGIGGIALTLILFFIFYGNLLRPIN